MNPLSDYVLIEVEPPIPYNKYASFEHIIVPDKFSHGPKDRAVFGTVLRKGLLCIDNQVEFKSKVVIEKWKGAYINASRSLMIVKESDILAVVK